MHPVELSSQSITVASYVIRNLTDCSCSTFAGFVTEGAEKLRRNESHGWIKEEEKG